MVNARIAEMIREKRMDEITNAIAEGEFFDMQTFSKSLIDLVLADLVELETAAERRFQPARLRDRGRPRAEEPGGARARRRRADGDDEQPPCRRAAPEVSVSNLRLARLDDALACGHGSRPGRHTLIEMMTVMVILGVVLTGLAVMFRAGVQAEMRANREYQAQQNARLALDRMRRELHCANAVAPNATPATSIIVTLPPACFGSDTTVTYATELVAAGRYRLTRAAGAAAAVPVADYLTANAIFTYYRPRLRNARPPRGRHPGEPQPTRHEHRVASRRRHRPAEHDAAVMARRPSNEGALPPTRHDRSRAAADTERGVPRSGGYLMRQRIGEESRRSAGHGGRDPGGPDADRHDARLLRGGERQPRGGLDRGREGAQPGRGGDELRPRDPLERRPTRRSPPRSPPGRSRSRTGRSRTRARTTR